MTKPIERDSIYRGRRFQTTGVAIDDAFRVLQYIYDRCSWLRCFDSGCLGAGEYTAGDHTAGCHPCRKFHRGFPRRSDGRRLRNANCSPEFRAIYGDHSSTRTPRFRDKEGVCDAAQTRAMLLAGIPACSGFNSLPVDSLGNARADEMLRC